MAKVECYELWREIKDTGQANTDFGETVSLIGTKLNPIKQAVKVENEERELTLYGTWGSATIALALSAFRTP